MRAAVFQPGQCLGIVLPSSRELSHAALTDVRVRIVGGPVFQQEGCPRVAFPPPQLLHAARRTSESLSWIASSFNRGKVSGASFQSLASSRRGLAEFWRPVANSLNDAGEALFGVNLGKHCYYPPLSEHGNVTTQREPRTVHRSPERPAHAARTDRAARYASPVTASARRSPAVQYSRNQGESKQMPCWLIPAFLGR